MLKYLESHLNPFMHSQVKFFRKNISKFLMFYLNEYNFASIAPRTSFYSLKWSWEHGDSKNRRRESIRGQEKNVELFKVLEYIQIRVRYGISLHLIRCRALKYCFKSKCRATVLKDGCIEGFHTDKVQKIIHMIWEWPNWAIYKISTEIGEK